MQVVNLALPYQIWFWGLLVIWALLLFGGFALAHPTASDMCRAPTWARLASSSILVLVGWTAYAANVLILAGATGALSLGVAVGMTLGALGDLLLARVIPMREPVLAGMGAFGLGHVAYVGGMLAWASQRHALVSPGLGVAWLSWLAVGALGWYVCVYRGQPCTVRHWAALPYALLLASTAGVATGLALRSTMLVPLAIGAALFLVSDLVLATNLFCARHFAGLHDVVWLTYGPGQMLIVYAILLPHLV